MNEGTAPTDTRLSPRQLWLLLVALFLGHTVMHCFQQAWYVILPSVQASFGISPVQYGAIESTRAFAAGVVNLPAALLSDLFKRHWVLILVAALSGLGIGYFVLGVATGYSVVLVAAILVGVSTSVWHPPAISTLSARFPGQVGMVLSVHGLGGNVGNTLGPLGVSFLLGLILWQTACQALATPLVALALVLWLVLRSLPGRQGAAVGGREYLSAIRALIRSGVVIGLGVSQGLVTMGTVTILAFFPLYCRQDLGFDASQAGYYFALMMASGILSQPVLGYLSDRIGRKAVIVPSLLLLSGFTVLLVWAGSGFELMLVAVGVGLFVYAINAIIQAAAMDATVEGTGAATVGFLFTSNFLFAAASPTLAGALSAAYGTPSVFIYSAGFILLAAGLVFLIPSGRAKG